MRPSTLCRLALASLLLTQLAAPLPSHAGWPPLFKGPQIYGTGSWSTSSTYRRGETQAVAAADLNGDGLTDLVTADPDGNLGGVSSISVLLHSGDLNVARLFKPKVNYPSPGGALYVVLADMNKDGKLDIVTSGYLNVCVLLGFGDGTFGATTTYPIPHYSIFRSAVADVNNDTWPDVVVPLLSDPGGVGVLLGTGNGSGGLGACTVYSPETPCSSVAVADVTGDGALDAVLGGSQDLTILAGNNAGAFSFQSIIPTSGGGGSDVAVGHLNADAFPDIVLAVGSSGPSAGVDILIGSGPGTWQPYVHKSLSPVGAFSVTLGDVTGDGALDIVASRETTRDGRYSAIVYPNLGNGTFGPSEYHSITAQSGPVVLADVNMNGGLDLIAPAKLVVGEYTKTHTVGVLLDDGAGGYLEGVWSFDTRQLNRAAIADFNRDGKPDVACTDSASVRVGLGNGTGAFTDIGGPASSVGPATVLAGDLNRDGIADIVFQNGTTTVTRHLGVGNGTFGAAANVGNFMIFHRSIVDLTQDGLPDVIGRLSPTSPSLRTYVQQPNGTFVLSAQVTTGQIRSLAHGDWNRDGKTDVMIAMANGVSFFPGTGSGLGAEVSVTTGRPYMDLCAGDFNRDGKLDVAALDSLAGQGGIRGFDVFLGNGTGGFALPMSTPTLDQNGVRIESWDANVDGILDLIVSEVSDPDPVLNDFSKVATVEVFLGDGSGRFGLQSAHGLGNTPSPAWGTTAPNFAAGDVNGDDLPDILSASTVLLPGGVSFRHNLQTLLSIPPEEDYGLEGHVDFTMSAGSSRVALGDLDRDGYLDVVTASLSDLVNVRLGTGPGTFGPSTTLAQSLAAWQVDLGDFNRDGILDLVTVRTSLGPPETVSIMLGVGDGTFGARTDFAIPGPADVAIADMNRDSKLDLVVARPQAGQVTVMTGNGDGTFTAQVGGTIPWAYDLDVVDVDRDGILDVVAAGGGFYYLHGNGDGTLANSVTIPTGVYHLQALCVDDINRDGRPDVAASTVEGPLLVAFGSVPGNPPFDSYVTSLLPSSGWDIQAGKATADGRTFLFQSSFGNRVLLLAPGGTPGSFTAVGAYPVGIDPESIVLGDLNRDGLIDAVTANSGTGNISVLLHGQNTVTGIAVVPGAAPPARLDQNAPNPFNPRTTVRYAVTTSGGVRLGVYDVQGRLVATLVDGFVLAGEHLAHWDGRTDQGNQAASGVYFYQLRTESGYQQSRRMVMLK